jgi:hypothetical protein
MKRLSISNAFLKLHEVKAIHKFQIAFVVKLNLENLVPQNDPPMLNIIGRLQNLRRNPINVYGTLILKRCDLGLNPLLQRC